MDERVRQIAAYARAHGLYVAVAESLTCGALISRLGAGPHAAEWLRGGLVAYDEKVKFEVLGVTPGPVVTERCARELARGVARHLSAELTIGITGVGGPDPSEGEPAGTVIVAVALHGEMSCQTFHCTGEPEDVIGAAVDHALTMLVEEIAAADPET